MTQTIEDELTIQQVAELTGVSAYTLRYYERIGLVESVNRASSGHRRYTSYDLAWISMLKRLRATGMSIQQMQEFAELRRQGPATLRQRLALLEKHQQEVRTHLRETEEHLAVIEAKIKLHRAQIERGEDIALETVNVGAMTTEEHIALIESKMQASNEPIVCELDLLDRSQKLAAGETSNA